MPAKTATPLKPDRIKPEFCLAFVPLHVNVCRLMAISCVEEKPIPSNLQDGRHIGSQMIGRVGHAHDDFRAHLQITDAHVIAVFQPRGVCGL